MDMSSVSSMQRHIFENDCVQNILEIPQNWSKIHRLVTERRKTTPKLKTLSGNHDSVELMCSVTQHPLLTETDIDVWQFRALSTVSNQEPLCLFSDSKARASTNAQTIRMMAEVPLLYSRKIQGRASVFILSSRVSLPPSFCQAPWHQVQQWGYSSPGNVFAGCFLLWCCLRCWEAPQFLGTLQWGACSSSYISKCLSFPLQGTSFQQLHSVHAFRLLWQDHKAYFKTSKIQFWGNLVTSGAREPTHESGKMASV